MLQRVIFVTQWHIIEIITSNACSTLSLCMSNISILMCRIPILSETISQSIISTLITANG